MKSIEIAFTYDEGLVKECTKNSVIKTKKTIVNINYIVSIEKWEGELIHKGRTGTKVTTSIDKSFIDDRDLEQFMECLNNIK